MGRSPIHPLPVSKGNLVKVSFRVQSILFTVLNFGDEIDAQFNFQLIPRTVEIFLVTLDVKTGLLSDPMDNGNPDLDIISLKSFLTVFQIVLLEKLSTHPKKRCPQK